MCITTLVQPVLETETVYSRTLAAAPPSLPALLVNLPALPTALRLAVHEENLARCNRYVAAYRAYLRRYCALIGDARSLDEIRDIGDVAAVLLPTVEPGVELDGDEQLIKDFRRRLDRIDDRAALRAVHEKTFALRMALAA